jgi:late competence protein required for DNA uptake (superfamily II DNA/RNA helicase)
MHEYQYKCPKCGTVETRIVSVDMRDKQYCRACVQMVSDGVEAVTLMKREYVVNFIIPEDFKAC